MVITSAVTLPEEHELDHPEIPLSSPALKAASFHLGKYCENQSNVSVFLNRNVCFVRDFYI